MLRPRRAERAQQSAQPIAAATGEGEGQGEGEGVGGERVGEGLGGERVGEGVEEESDSDEEPVSFS